MKDSKLSENYQFVNLHKYFNLNICPSSVVVCLLSVVPSRTVLTSEFHHENSSLSVYTLSSAAPGGARQYPRSGYFLVFK